MVAKVTAPMKLEIKLLKDQVSTLKKEVADLEKFQKFIRGRHDDLTDDYNKVLFNNIKCNQGIEHLNRRMTHLQKKYIDKEFKLDALEQYDSRQNLKFVQVPYHEGENVTQIVLDLVSKLEVKLDNEDISIAYRLPQKKHSSTNKDGSQKSAHPAIIARFVSRDKRNKLYENRFIAKDIDDFPVDGMTELYINENLTQRRKRLFWRSKQQAKELSYKYIWTNNGQIYVRKDKNHERILITTETDLDKL